MLNQLRVEGLVPEERGRHRIRFRENEFSLESESSTWPKLVHGLLFE